MDRYILTLILLILISSGILYIYSKKKRTKETLDTLSNTCLRGCQPASVVTGNCRPHGVINNKTVHSCPQECITENLNRLPDTCSYDGDCKNCKKSLLYSNGRPYYPQHRKKAAIPTIPGSKGTPSIVPASKGTPPSSINLPTAPFSPTKTNGGSDLCPASTVIIIER